MQQAWVSAIKQLCDILQQSEGRIKLLREIDLAVTNENITIEELLSRALRNLVMTLGASEGSIYIISGEDLILLDSTGVTGVSEKLNISVLERIGMHSEEKNITTTKTSNLDEVPEGIPIAEELLFIPLNLSDDENFAILILESQSPVESFTDKSTSEFIITVSKQLSNALSYRLRITKEKYLNDLTKSFFKEHLSPSTCYENLAKSVCDFLPSYGPLKIDPAPQIQILTYDKNDDYLTIKATTGLEQDITRVSVKNSVCGLLVAEDSKPVKKRKRFILGDPAEFGNIYKSYLGKAAGQIILTELALPIYHEEELIGVLNLESQLSNAFQKPHIDSMLELCSNFGPIIHALKERTESNILQQRALSSSLDNYFGYVGRLLRHGTATPNATIIGQLVLIQEKIGKKEPWLEKHLEIIKRNLDENKRFVDEFRKRIVGFSSYGKYSISKIISGAISPFNLEEIKKQNITIEIKKGADPDVYCSPLLDQHLYNLINNSKYAIEKRYKTGDNRPGRIVISVKDGPKPEKGQEEIYNIRYEISIWDNGIGISQEELTQVRKFLPGYTTKRAEGGSGLGLYAAQKYMVSLGGWIEVDSKENEYFVVSFLLDKFNPSIHKKIVKYEWV